VGAGYFLSDSVGGNFKKLLTSWGYAITVSDSGFFGLGAHTDEYPMGKQGNFFMSFKVDYSLSPRWALRLSGSPVQIWAIEGRRQWLYRNFSRDRDLVFRAAPETNPLSS